MHYFRVYCYSSACLSQGVIWTFTQLTQHLPKWVSLQMVPSFEVAKIFLLGGGCNFFQTASVRHLGSYIGAHKITMPVLKNHPALLWQSVLIGCLPSVAVFLAHTFAWAVLRRQKWKKKMNYLSVHVKKHPILLSLHWFYFSFKHLPFILMHFLKSLLIENTVRCQMDTRRSLKLKDGSLFWHLDLALNLFESWYIWPYGKADSASQNSDLNQNSQHLLKLQIQ